MIKVKAVLSKIFNEFSDENIFEKSDFSDLSHFQCPVCKRRGDFKRIHPYCRYMITIADDSRKDVLVEVPRIQCPSCNHTHALLPDNLIPFGSYTIRFVIKVLSEYLKRSVPVTVLCENYDISISTLYSWKNLLTYHHSILLGIMHAMNSLCEKVLSDITNFDSLPEAFFSTFGFSFLQYHATFSCRAPASE